MMNLISLTFNHLFVTYSTYKSDFSSLNDPDHYHDDGDDQQDMNDSTHRVATQQIPATTELRESHIWSKACSTPF